MRISSLMSSVIHSATLAIVIIGMFEIATGLKQMNDIEDEMRKLVKEMTDHNYNSYCGKSALYSNAFFVNKPILTLDSVNTNNVVMHLVTTNNINKVLIYKLSE